MKKILIIALALSLCLLVACTGVKKNMGITKGTPTVKTSPSPTTTISERIGPSPSPTTGTSEQVGSGNIGKYRIEIKNYELTKDYKNKPSVIITYSWTNNSEEANSFATAINHKVYQGGVECGTAILTNNKVNLDDQLKSIKPGTTYEVKAAYVLQNETSDLVVEAKELLTFESNPPMVKQTYKIAQ